MTTLPQAAVDPLLTASLGGASDLSETYPSFEPNTPLAGPSRARGRTSPPSPSWRGHPGTRRTPSRSKYDKPAVLAVHMSPGQVYSGGGGDTEKGFARPASPPPAVVGGWRGLGSGLGLGLGQWRKGRSRVALVGVVLIVLLYHSGWQARSGQRRAYPSTVPSPMEIDTTSHSVKPSDFEWPSDPPSSLSSLSDPLLSWGLNLDTEYLHPSGLSSLFAAHPAVPAAGGALSNLGPEADAVYSLGPATWTELYGALDAFVRTAAPQTVQQAFRRMYGGKAAKDASTAAPPPAWDGNKVVWQTDKDEDKVDSGEVGTWRHGAAKAEGWEWELVTDEKAESWISTTLKDTLLHRLWHALPSGILRSDYLRYLLLALHGGIYTDTDTSLLQAPSAWVRVGDMDLWRGGMGWLDVDEVERIAAARRVEGGEELEAVLQEVLAERPLGAVVGVEADVGERADWADWWPRPLQIAQWTMSTAPLHPISLLALQRIAQNTADAVTWSRAHANNISALFEQAAELQLASTSTSTSSGVSGSSIHPTTDIDTDTAATTDTADTARAAALRLATTNVLSEPKSGGPLGIVNWTGPGVWTDAVLTYLRARYGVRWTDLRGLERPLRVGDVLILPVTGFSPGVGNFGAKAVGDPLAMVEHGFKGSWKSKDM